MNKSGSQGAAKMVNMEGHKSQGNKYFEAKVKRREKRGEKCKNPNYRSTNALESKRNYNFYLFIFPSDNQKKKKKRGENKTRPDSRFLSDAGKF